MKVAALAQAHDLDIAPHGSQDIHIHLVAAISNGLILEYYRDTVDPMWAKMYHTHAAPQRRRHGQPARCARHRRRPELRGPGAYRVA